MIYIVEDDAAIRELEQYALQSSGYEVTSFESSEPFWQAMHAAEPELVILDVMLPGEDGFSILKKLRNTPSLRRLPIIMVTAKSSELDTVRGLDCGADDYISKPFGIMEFLSRVRAALRRSAPEARPNVLSFHEILLDNARHNVTVSGTPVELTYKEYSLLRLLLENTNLVVTRETILQVVWGTDISVESRTVDMHIRTLRKKLGVGHGVDGKVPTLQIFLQAGRKGYFFRMTAIFILAIHPVGGNLESLFFKQHCYGSVSDSCIYGSVKQGFDLLRLG